MNAKTITEADIVRYHNNDAIAARRISVTTSKDMRISRWEVESYPTWQENTFLTFIDNKLESMTSVKKPELRRSYRR